jgi:hypothetical protein
MASWCAVLRGGRLACTCGSRAPSSLRVGEPKTQSTTQLTPRGLLALHVRRARVRSMGGVWRGVKGGAEVQVKCRTHLPQKKLLNFSIYQSVSFFMSPYSNRPLTLETPLIGSVHSSSYIAPLSIQFVHGFCYCLVTSSLMMWWRCSGSSWPTNARCATASSSCCRRHSLNAV